MHLTSPLLSAALLLLSSLTTALPPPARRQATTTSKGFKLIAKVTDPTHDLTPSISGFFLSAIHVGAGTSRATLSSGNSRVFYHNGTAAEVSAGKSRVLTDGGTPPFPWSLDVQSASQTDGPAYPGFHAVYLNAGPGPTGEDPEVGIDSSSNALVNHLAGGGGGSFVACNHTVPYYGPSLRYIVLDYAYDGEAAEGCAPITLVPQCAQLNDLPPDAISSHDSAVSQSCEPAA